MLKVEQGNAGLWYVTSDVIPGLLVAGDTQKSALEQVGQALADIQAAMDAAGSGTPAPGSPSCGELADPNEAALAKAYKAMFVPDTEQARLMIRYAIRAYLFELSSHKQAPVRLERRPEGSNADEWHLFLTQFADSRATSPNGLTYLAVQIAEAIEAAAVPQSAASTVEPVAWRWASIFNPTDWSVATTKPAPHEQYITEPLYAAPTTSPEPDAVRVEITDEMVDRAVATRTNLIQGFSFPSHSAIIDYRADYGLGTTVWSAPATVDPDADSSAMNLELERVKMRVILTAALAAPRNDRGSEVR